MTSLTIKKLLRLLFLCILICIKQKKRGLRMIYQHRDILNGTEQKNKLLDKANCSFIKR